MWDPWKSSNDKAENEARNRYDILLPTLLAVNRMACCAKAEAASEVTVEIHTSEVNVLPRLPGSPRVSH